MLTPALAVLYLRIFSKEKIELGFRGISIKWFILAILVFPVAIHLVCLPVVFFDSAYSIPWQEWLFVNDNGMYTTPDWGNLDQSGLVLRLLINAFVGILIASILAFFEEVGWRSWMLPKLINKYNLKKGVILSAIIWALWHIPFVLGDIHSISGVDKHWLLIINPMGHIGAGIVLAWIWIRTKNIVITSFAHGSLNNWGQLAFKYMSDEPGSGNLTLLIALNITLFLLGLNFYKLLFKIDLRKLESEKFLAQGFQES